MAAAARGGAIYVATGGTLTILDTPITGAAVAGGAGGTQGVGQGPDAVQRIARRRRQPRRCRDLRSAA